MYSSIADASVAESQRKIYHSEDGFLSSVDSIEPVRRESVIQQSYVIAGLLGRDGTDPGPETRPARCDVRPCLLPRFRDILSEKSIVKLSEGDFISEGGVFLWLHVNMVMIWSIYNHLFPVYYRWQNLCSPITRLQILTSGNIDGRNKFEVKETSAWADA